MNQAHDTLTPTRPAKAKRLTPDTFLLSFGLLDLLRLLLSATLLKLIVAGDPLLLTDLVDELGAVLFKRRHRVKRELVVAGDKYRRTRHHECGQGFIAAHKVLDVVVRDGDQMGFEMLRVRHQHVGGYHGDEGLCG